MFEGFKLSMIDTGEALIRVRHGGSGPPLLLLHGHPQTHVMWHKVAPRLARATSASSPPTCAATATAASRRRRPTMRRTRSARWRATRSRSCAQLGFERFFVAGHDRGGARRLPHGARPPRARPRSWPCSTSSRPARRSAAPTWRSASATGTGSSWRSPHDLPERLIGADPDDYYFRHAPRPKSRDFFDAGGAGRVPAAASTTRDPIHAICEDYRAGADVRLRARRGRPRPAAHRLPACSRSGAAQARSKPWYDVLAIWRDWADDVRGRAIHCGHYLAEEAPDETYAELRAFFGA